MKTLDEVYGIHKTDNAEIRLRFYRTALKSGKDYAQIAAGELGYHLWEVCITDVQTG